MAMDNNKLFEAKIVTHDIELLPREDKVMRAIGRARRLLKALAALEVIHWPLLVVGSGLSLYIVLTRPTPLAYTCLFLYTSLWLTKLLRFLRLPRYGTVTDVSGKPLGNTVIQLTNDAIGTEAHILSTITDGFGRFVLLAKPGVYTMIVTKEGFRPFTKMIEAEEANITISLEAIE